jgi:adenylate cyclase
MTNPADAKVQRRLAAILAADVVGFSALMSQDEEGTLARIKSLRRELIEPMVHAHYGRVVKTTGDGFLVEFSSPVEAVSCAVEVQEALVAKTSQETSQAVHLRIGINLGDIIIEPDGDIYGDGVNVAARLEQIAEPGGIWISGKVYEEVRGKLPYHFDDKGEQWVKNIGRPVRLYGIRTSASLTARTATFTPSRSDKPSIAVLPFTNRSGDPEQDYFADGMTEDLITGLSRLRWLNVIACTSSFNHTEVRQFSFPPGARYILEGSVRRSGDRIRINGQLIGAATGKHIWAERYDRELMDIFAVQDEITENVVAAIEPHLYMEEGLRAANQVPESIGVWGLVVQAIGLINRVGRHENEQARTLLERAIMMEPTYAKAHAVLSWAVWWASYNYWLPDEQQGREQAQHHAEEALALDPSEPWAHMVFGLCLSTAGQHDRAQQELEIALGVNPSFALAHSVYGWTLTRAGKFEVAVAETAKALRMSPSDSFTSLYEFVHGVSLMAAQRHYEALPYLRKALVAFPDFPTHHSMLIACCGHLGLLDEAKAALARRNNLGPPLTVDLARSYMRKFAFCSVVTEGLSKAGVPEH